MLTPQLRRIFQLPSLITPKVSLSGAYTVWDVPLGPVAGAYKTVRGTPEQLAEYLGELAAYNAQASLRKSVEFRTIAERQAAGYAQPGASTLEELDPLSLCLGTEIYVSNDPSGQHEYKVVYDGSGPLLVWVDGNFAQSPRGKIPAAIVANASVGPGPTPGAGLAYTALELASNRHLFPDEVLAELQAALDDGTLVWIYNDGSGLRTTLKAKDFGVLPGNASDANAQGVEALRTAILALQP